MVMVMKLPELKTGLAVLGVLNAVDWALTLYALELGAYEQNPLLEPFCDDPFKYTAVKLGLGSGAVAVGIPISKNLKGNAKALAEILISTAIILYVFVVVSNTIKLVSYLMKA